MKQVLIFKTSVGSYRDLGTVEPLLNKLLGKAEKWNFDLDDCDKILRVESVSIEASAIIESLNTVGVACLELE